MPKKLKSKLHNLLHKQSSEYNIADCVTFSLYAGPATETHPDGTPVAQAQIAWHAAEDSRPLLAMAMGHTLFIAALDSFDSKAPVPEWDCTDTSDLPLSCMTSLQLADNVRCLAFSPDGLKLAAVNSAEKVCHVSSEACRAVMYITVGWLHLLCTAHAPPKASSALLLHDAKGTVPLQQYMHNHASPGIITAFVKCRSSLPLLI